MKKLSLEQMEVVEGGFSRCDVAASIAGASFTYVLQGVGTAICPGVGTIAGWALGTWASLVIADRC
ncbi:hypothetical protein [Alistipes sp. ZOR0009]|uniref:hypothetical protein n=1 Tax=Alistipes sp. ZOR0009 TaxID=1339253 RepID=UPI00064906D7|nr:hypothetical protein [Alistipes sp. ZOR0009]